MIFSNFALFSEYLKAFNKLIIVSFSSSKLKIDALIITLKYYLSKPNSRIFKLFRFEFNFVANSLIKLSFREFQLF